MTNVNYVDESLKNATVPRDFLDSIYIGQYDVVTQTEFEFAIPVHYGSFTDVNIWSRALNIDEMISWTNCR